MRWIDRVCLEQLQARRAKSVLPRNALIEEELARAPLMQILPIGWWLLRPAGQKNTKKFGASAKPLVRGLGDLYVSPPQTSTSQPHCATTISALRAQSHSVHTMASLHSIPRFLLPRGPSLLRIRTPSPYPSRILPLALRYTSTLPPRPKSLAEQIRKPSVIPQPDKYRPPSHGRRTPRSETAMRSYGPKLSEEDKERMRTKKYPNMMSPEGTFSHWFLNNRAIHLWISMVRFCVSSL